MHLIRPTMIVGVESWCPIAVVRAAMVLLMYVVMLTTKSSSGSFDTDSFHSFFVPSRERLNQQRIWV